MNARADRFPLFDSLRAVAALAVLGFHAAFLAGREIPDATLFRQLAGRLDVGVTIFFLISGFLLYRPFVRARLDGERVPRVVAYLWRRALRIAPAYWVALVVVTLWLGLDGVFAGDKILDYFLFAQIYGADTALGGIGQAWTLCVEVSFYAFLPLWALLMRALPARGDRRRALTFEVAGLALLFAFSFAYKLWALRQVAPTELTAAPYLMPLPNFLDQFALGMGLAVVSVWYQGRDRDLPRPMTFLRAHAGLGWLVALVAFVLAATAIGYSGDPQQHYSRTAFVLRHELYSVVALGILVAALFAQPGRGFTGRLLGNRVLAYLGLISYGIYLYHFAVLQKLEGVLHDVLPESIFWRLIVYVPLGTLGAALIAALSYYVVERPALSLKRLVPMRGKSARGEAITEPAPAAPTHTP
jgi:peptidoglycan/LPS O-acetylase OafA/YrhL